MTKAVTAHRNEAHPDLNTKTWMGLMAKQRFKRVRKGDNLKKAAVKRHDATRKRKFKTHRPIELDLSQEELGATKNGTPRQWWCADCLHIIAGYNARPKTSTCAQNRRSQRAPHAVAYAWKTLQKRNNIEPLRRALGPWVKKQLGLTSSDPAPASSSWQRDLTEDGDIEAQPGPSASSGNDARPPTVWSLNVGGAKGAWDMVPLLNGGPKSPCFRKLLFPPRKPRLSLPKQANAVTTASSQELRSLRFALTEAQ